MTGISAVEIAKKQRYLHLLQKVKENKTLSKVELDELRRYERKMVGKVILGNLRKRSTKRSTKPSTRPSTKRSTKQSTKQSKKSKKKILVAKRVRMPVEEAEVCRLGLECENLTEADAAIRTRKSLAEIFKKHSELREAWDRGRFLRNLRDLAKTGASVTEAAKRLGFASARGLQAMLDEDVEIADLWDQTQLGIRLEIKTAIIEAAREGKPDAVRAVEAMLQNEKEQAGADLTRITTRQLVEITGRHRKTIHDWVTKFGMPRNVDKTFDLSFFLAWFEDFLLGKSGKGEMQEVVLDPYRAMKVEKLKAELARHRNETLDRKAVIIQLVAWAQHLVSYCNRHNDELSRLCIGQPREKVLEIHRHFFRELHASIARVPKELHLPDDKEKELVAFLRKLRPQDGRNKNV